MPGNRKNILLCTLGASWAVVPEVYAFLAPDKLALYRNHPRRDELENQRREYSLAPPDEIWVCTTLGEKTCHGVQQLTDWIGRIPDPPVLRIWQAQGTDQLANREECDKLRELLLRAVLNAHDEAQGGQVVLSLAGGRKTMSADLQWAGQTLGCTALLHVVGKDRLPESLGNPQPDDLCDALIAGDAESIVPLVAGNGHRSELLDVELDGREAVDAKRFDLPRPEHCQPLIWCSPPGVALQREIRDRETAGSQLFGNYIAMLSANEHHENWRSLYRLPPRIIGILRETRLDESHRTFLKKLPKTDLHRHLGGCLGIPAQRRVAQAIWDELTAQARAGAIKKVTAWLRSTQWPAGWPDSLRRSGMRPECCAALLVKASDEQLEHNLYGATRPRVGLKDRLGFSAYELPGELSGSALLFHPAALEPYIAEVMRQATEEGLSYVELRGSPQKYGDGLDFPGRLNDAVRMSKGAFENHQLPLIRFIVIGDRRKPARLDDVVRTTVKARADYPDLIVGLDLAGDEGTNDPKKLSRFFEPAFEACLPLTIHAGEGEPAHNIWQAAYHLHADRIGHGLTIVQRPDLAQRFRDRNICLELCPTSNREVIGFRDPAIPESSVYEPYPLLQFMKQGLPLTLCTDNPGISRTTIPCEFLAAARMTGGAISLWDALAIIKQGFSHAFLPKQEKEPLITRMDRQVYQIVLEEFSREAKPGRSV